LADPVTGQLRPITFDARQARNHRDVVLAHLAHPLVAQATRLLQKAVWSSAGAAGAASNLHRVTAVVSDDPMLESSLVGAYARYVLVGAVGVRLYEEVLYAGGWVRDAARPFARLENLTTLGSILDKALTEGVEAAPALRERMVEAWPRVRDGVVSALEWRKNSRLTSLENKLEQRKAADQARISSNLTQFATSLRSALAEDQDEDALFSEIDLKDARELKQWRDDRQAWQDRLDRLDDERDRELAAIAARYHQPQDHLFPVAVIFVIPRREAVR